MAAAGGVRGSGLASAPASAGDTSLLGSATTWPLKRYGRFLPPKDGDDEGQNTSWKEGFSLIDSHKWLKIVRRAECLLLRAQAKNECRMFRVQFGGSSREEMQEHCCSCVQKLSEYVLVQGAEDQSQQLCHGLSQDTQGMDTEHAPDEPLLDSCTSLGERRSVAQLAQLVLRQQPELPPALQHPAWSARELGPFIRLCLMDQHFPAFVEDVEKELLKLAEE
ncbi:meiotic recombination protein REC114 isoform X2 [Corvus hawaiiensis]|uniref:meiotic recombination protein REC114 isoform X2 n=1 Tax=Corvus hawaiiensis TaxID=134902 RepID=UPI002019F717|nr:meiotic recombination protein REC114 isoform X2 [Corvus hawaiiensis]